MTPWIIIDGYNLLHRSPALRLGTKSAMERERHRLIRQLEEVAGELAGRLTVVFDGGAAEYGRADGSAAVEVVFSTADRSADGVIAELVRGHPRPAEICVVSSDRMVRYTAAAAGAESTACSIFLEQVTEARAAVSQRVARRLPKSSGPRLGDFFPGGK